MAGIPDSTASVQDSTLLIIDAQNEYAEGERCLLLGYHPAPSSTNEVHIAGC